MHVEYSPEFLKRAARLPRQIVELFYRKEALFRIDSYHPSLDTHKLHGKDDGSYALSINRKYRVKFIFLPDGGALFFDIGTHDIYQ